MANKCAICGAETAFAAKPAVRKASKHTIMCMQIFTESKRTSLKWSAAQSCGSIILFLERRLKTKQRSLKGSVLRCTSLRTSD